jgi:hypothetical protein
MLTGRVPFDGESSQEIIMKHLTADPDLSGVPQPYRAIIQRALQKDPEKRFRTASEMVAALVPAGAAVAGPLYIGDDSEGIEFGPLQLHAATSPVAAEIIRANGHGAARGGFRALPEEPVAGALTSTARRFANWWRNGLLATPVKIALLLFAALIAVLNGGRLLVVAVVLGSIYLVYSGIRLLVRAVRPRRSSTDLVLAKPVEQTPRCTGGWHGAQLVSWEEAGRQILREKTAADRIGELTGSMLAAAMIAAVLTAIMAAVGAEKLQSSSNPNNGLAWFWLMTSVGSWLALAAGKCCECSSGEVIRRRFGMLMVGLVFAAAACMTSQYLMVTFDDASAMRRLANSGLVSDLYDPAGSPKLPAFLAYFGAIFLTIGWWKQTDPLRSSRLRIGPILIAILFAWLWQLVWPFPQPWGFMLVASISIATQLSAPWLSPADRTAAIARRTQIPMKDHHA